mmetsp:Transcript_58490/g.131551  ORF Transcript_58490/g.131551 Transcript_58490/m.131551 type:complete len:210 (-) Transcript_58490:65-694(-)
MSALPMMVPFLVALSFVSGGAVGRASTGLNDVVGLLQSSSLGSRGSPEDAQDAATSRHRSWPRCSHAEKDILRPMLQAVGNNTNEAAVIQLFADSQRELKANAGIGIPGLSQARMPSTCKGILDKQRRYNRDLHISCFRESYAVSERCAACTVDFWYNMVVTCQQYCSKGLNDVMCQTCSPPSKFQECYTHSQPQVVTVGLEAQNMVLR